VRIPVKNITLTIINKAAKVGIFHGSHLRICLKAVMNISTAPIEIIKATANPAEYSANRVTSVDSDALEVALARILANIGPMHGAQPPPNTS
jgi:hypothetical protein